MKETLHKTRIISYQIIPENSVSLSGPLNSGKSKNLTEFSLGVEREMRKLATEHVHK